jgi:outer membrane protein TolC
VGKGLQQDVLKAQVELSLMTERIINLRQKREQLEAGLNQLLNRPVTQAVASAQGPAFKAQTLSFDQLRELALENRPLLELWKQRLLQSGRMIELARKNLLPDFAVTAAYTQRSVLANGLGGADFFTTGISLNLPIYARSKQKQQVIEQQIMQRGLEERREDVLQTVERDIDNALTELNKTADLVELYRGGIVPQAGQALESSLIGYQTDKVDFLTLISSQMTLLKLELEYTRLISTYYKNIAELEFIIGTSLPTN